MTPNVSPAVPDTAKVAYDLLADTQPKRPVCGFCFGKPVHDASTWLDGKPRPPAACPRCGETNTPAKP